jgi:hypothetical protein
MPPATAPAIRIDWGHGLLSGFSILGRGALGRVFSWACQARREITKRTLLEGDGEGAAAVDRRRRSVVVTVDDLLAVAFEAMDIMVD